MKKPTRKAGTQRSRTRRVKDLASKKGQAVKGGFTANYVRLRTLEKQYDSVTTDGTVTSSELEQTN